MCIVDGGFNELVSWETCSKSCETGISIRKLTCTKPSPKYGGKPCLGDNYREKECNTEPCPSKNNFVNVYKVCTLVCIQTNILQNVGLYAPVF